MIRELPCCPVRVAEIHVDLYIIYVEPSLN